MGNGPVDDPTTQDNAPFRVDLVLKDISEKLRDGAQQAALVTSDATATVRSTFLAARDAIHEARQAAEMEGGGDVAVVFHFLAQATEGTGNIVKLVVDEVHAIYCKNPSPVASVLQANNSIIDVASLPVNETILIGVGAALAAQPLSVLLSALGWQSAGVAAGSVAAALQSTIYGAKTGGVFSLLQSAGALSTGAAVNVPSLLSGAALIGTALALWAHRKAQDRVGGVDGAQARVVAPDLLAATIREAVQVKLEEIRDVLRVAVGDGVKRLRSVKLKAKL